MNTNKAILGALLTTLALGAAAEEIPETGLSVHLESAGLLGSGTSLNISRLPILNVSTNEVSYYDIVLKFTLDGSNQLALDRISSIAVSAPPSPQVCIPGVYEDGDRRQYRVSGPVTVPGGRLSCVLSGVGFTTDISWTSGSPVGHPEIGARRIAADLPEGYAYGLAGAEADYSFYAFLGAGIRSGDIVGVKQIGVEIKVFDFTKNESNNVNTDQRNPVTSIGVKLVEPRAQ